MEQGYSFCRRGPHCQNGSAIIICQGLHTHFRTTASFGQCDESEQCDSHFDVAIIGPGPVMACWVMKVSRQKWQIALDKKHCQCGKQLAS